MEAASPLCGESCCARGSALHDGQAKRGPGHACQHGCSGSPIDVCDIRATAQPASSRVNSREVTFEAQESLKALHVCDLVVVEPERFDVDELLKSRALADFVGVKIQPADSAIQNMPAEADGVHGLLCEQERRRRALSSQEAEMAFFCARSAGSPDNLRALLQASTRANLTLAQPHRLRRSREGKPSVRAFSLRNNHLASQASACRLEGYDKLASGHQRSLTETAHLQVGTRREALDVRQVLLCQEEHRDVWEELHAAHLRDERRNGQTRVFQPLRMSGADAPRNGP